MTNQGSDDVSAYQIGKNGFLTPIAGSPFTAGGNPDGVVVDPLRRFLYVTNETSNSVSAYQIGKNGSLAPIAGSPFPTGIAPVSVTISPQFQKE